MQILNQLISSKIKLKQKLTPLYDYLRVKVAQSQKAKMEPKYLPYLKNRKIKTIQVAVTNFCNARCVFCGQHKFSRPKGVMSKETFDKILYQALGLWVGELDFTPTLGDPLLDRGLEEKLKAAAFFFDTMMTTNGILLANDFDNPKFEWVAKYCDLTRISIGGLDRESYHKAYKVDKYDDVITGVLSLLYCIWSKQYLSKVHLFFRSGNSPKSILNSPDWKRIEPYIKSGILTYEFTNSYDNWGGMVRSEDLIGEMLSRTPKAKIGVPCFSLKAIFIEHQGNVRLCGCRFKDKEDDDLVIGNINEKPLNEILSHENQYKLYQRFMGDDSNLPDICRDCTLYRPFISSEFRS